MDALSNPARNDSAGDDDADAWTGPVGLSASEAAGILARHGPNAVADEGPGQRIRRLLRPFSSPLVLILLVGACVSLALREWVDASIILLIVGGSGLIGLAQEARADVVIRSLHARLAPSARVIRDARPLMVPARDLVPGDVVLLNAGARVPADGLVLQATDCLVEEASLTGESFPVFKHPPDKTDQAPDPRRHQLFVGSSVRSGMAVMRVTATGRQTLYGETTARLALNPPPTAFERGLTDFGGLLLRVMLIMVIFVLVVNHALGRPVIESLLFAVALAVGLSPELLPAIVTVTLAQGARRMAARGTFVRRLQAIENLGGVDVLCTDKTGTLTQGLMSLQAALDADGQPDEEVLRLGWLNAVFQAGIDNPLDAAIGEAGRERGLSIESWRRITELPYDFVRRRLSIVVSQETAGLPSAQLLITKGAVDAVLTACSRVRRGADEMPLDATLRERLLADCAQRGLQGARLLAVATAHRAPQAHWAPQDERDLVLQGFLCFLDPPRPDARSTLQALRDSGIRIVLITGDNRWVAASLALAVGLDSREPVCGADLATMDDAALAQRVRHADVFAQIDPLQKARIVRALKRQGHTVGFLGDGINDVAALHEADVGLSVQGAVDIARDRADVVLTRTDLSVLHEGILEGRRTFANTLKYIAITTSANFGNMVSMALATPLLPFLPLAVTQILLNNFLSDLPSMALAADRVDPEQTARPQNWTRVRIRRFMLIFGLISTAFDLLSFWLLTRWFDTDEAHFQTAWFITSVLTELAVVAVLRTRLPVWRSRPGAWLTGLTIAVAIVAIALPWIAPLAAPFGLVPLPAVLMGTLLGVVIAYIAVTEAIKQRFGWLD